MLLLKQLNIIFHILMSSRRVSDCFICRAGSHHTIVPVIARTFFVKLNSKSYLFLKSTCFSPVSKLLKTGDKRSDFENTRVLWRKLCGVEASSWPVRVTNYLNHWEKRLVHTSLSLTNSEHKFLYFAKLLMLYLREKILAWSRTQIRVCSFTQTNR